MLLTLEFGSAVTGRTPERMDGDIAVSSTVPASRRRNT
jgi:hypothetical protein